MAERSLRGMKIGTNSLESDIGVAFVPRTQVRYECSRGHRFAIAFADDAEAPQTWDCTCGCEAIRTNLGEDEVERKAIKPARTHWDMLCERRTEDELKVLLNERLDLLRRGKLRVKRKFQGKSATN